MDSKKQIIKTYGGGRKDRSKDEGAVAHSSGQRSVAVVEASGALSDASMTSMSDCSVALTHRPMSYWVKKIDSCNKRRRMETVDTGSEPVSSDEEAAPAKVMVAIGGDKRGRGRPPSTGKYVGMAKAQAELTALRREEERRRAEDEVAAKLARMKARQAVEPPVLPSQASGTATDLMKQVENAADVIVSVATKSGNLKGSYIKALKEAAASITAAMGELHGRTVTDETAKLQSDNARLRKEMEVLRKELAEVKAKMSEPTPTQTSTSTHADSSRQQEELVQSIMRQMGGMLNARFEGIEERLLPEKRLRPPLASDKRKSAQEEAAPSPPSRASEGTQPASQPSKAKTKKKSMAAREAAGLSQPDRPPPTEPTNSGQSWAEVTKSAKKQKAPEAKKGPTPKKGPSKKRKIKLRPPRTEAVVIALQPAAVEKGVTYASVLKAAQQKFDLSSCGINSIRFRKAMTGARILEVPAGNECGEKADKLAQKLREVLDVEVARVSRPTKCTGFRVSGLDDSVSQEDIAAATAQQGNCNVADVKVGEIKRSLQGTGVVLVNCPVVAAKKLNEEGRLRVGWVSAKVELLQPRPLRCYRCLELGHVRAQCSSEVDRGDECYRCGQPGHKSATCSAVPKCSVCAAADKPSAHRLGGKECAPPSKSRRGKAGNTQGGTFSFQSNGNAKVRMETN